MARYLVGGDLTPLSIGQRGFFILELDFLGGFVIIHFVPKKYFIQDFQDYLVDWSRSLRASSPGKTVPCKGALVGSNPAVTSSLQSDVDVSLKAER